MTPSRLNGAPTRGELESLVVAAVYRQGTQALLGLDPRARGLLRGEWRTAFDAAFDLAKRGEVGLGGVPPELAVAEVERLGGDSAAVRIAIDASIGYSGERAARVGAANEAVEQLAELAAAGPLPARLAELAIGRHLDALGTSIDEGVQRLATGWTRLDEALGGGFAVPSLNVLGAAPKSGKSTWAQHIAVHHLEQGGAVLYVDLENGRRRFLRQLMCRKAELGGKAVHAAMANERAGVFSSRSEAERWAAAKAWVRQGLALLFASFNPPDDWRALLREARRAAGARKLLVVVDSLQKLPGDLSDRRAVVDAWIRLFEELRHELDLVFLVISEIKRGQDGAYKPGESSFKESGGIEYAGDLLLTMTRPRAEDDEAPLSTLRVELARDCDEDPRGDVASYAPVFPHYGLQELDPAPRKEKRRSGPRASARGDAETFLRTALAGGPVQVADLLAEAKRANISESSLRRAGRELGLATATLNLKAAWRLP